MEQMWEEGRPQTPHIPSQHWSRRRGVRQPLRCSGLHSKQLTLSQKRLQYKHQGSLFRLAALKINNIVRKWREGCSFQRHRLARVARDQPLWSIRKHQMIRRARKKLNIYQKKFKRNTYRTHSSPFIEDCVSVSVQRQGTLRSESCQLLDKQRSNFNRRQGKEKREGERTNKHSWFCVHVCMMRQ